MKLLSPSAIKDNKALEMQREILRIQETQKASDRTRKDLANAEADFKNTLAKNREVWASEEEEHSKRLKEMDSEIKALEVKRERLLAPLEEKERQLGVRLQAIILRETSLRDKEEELESISNRLQDKLDLVGQQQQDYNRDKAKLEAEKLGIAEQQDSIRAQSKKLTSDLVLYETKKKEFEQDMEQRKTALFLWDRTLQATEERNKRNIAAVLAREEAMEKVQDESKEKSISS